MLYLRSDSTEYATASLTTDHDITGRTIEVATPLTGDAPVEWFTAEVVTVEETSDDPVRWVTTYRLLMGPEGDDALSTGVYDWIARLTDSPEKPVRNPGQVKVD